MTPIEPRWYCVSPEGWGLCCHNEEHALAEVARRTAYPYRAVLLGDVAAERETIQRLQEEADSFHMAYRMKCDKETKAQAVEIQRLREALKALIACHDEPECPAVSVARDALKT